MKSRFFCVRSQSGIGLVELLVALLLSVIIGGAVVQVFISQRQSFQTQDDLARLQENARFAFEQISRDLRHVGYWGCSRKAPITNETNDTGLDDISTKALTRANDGALTIRFLNPDVVVTDANLLGSLPSNRLVADCAKASLFQGNTLPAGYSGTGWQAFGLSEVQYKAENGGLVRVENGASDNLIADGVVSISFEYGVADSGGFADDYLENPDPGQLENTVSLKTTLVMQGTDVVGQKTFVSVVAIRNRLP
jgi:type IV pilus assembly protein PilW